MAETVTIEKALLEEYIKDVKILSELYKNLLSEKETYRDFLGEKGLTDEYKHWLKVNGWEE